ncbi:ketoacyl-ACP synthase III family protein [Streptomyces sp. UNOB3_S3]|uniref:ketoacyl-ACP synthase III family protein n=1 Tax=Streptomyces sp. UNOB3_S3 TaxID=2871682 RepID=UPI001E5C95FE|nr:ketoacyl-ACP synthase III family protein [Streptomyces sp. UNOB3_S3]MCC3778315.1 ketoacyl-ACP synthase III family protein [Streptomyces sp. UNOB3_S3]
MRAPGGIVVTPAEWLPDTTVKAVEALADGLVTQDEAESIGYEQLPVSGGESAPEMAVLAGRAALERSGVAPASVRAVLHAWTYYQGHDFWSPAHYVADRTGATGGVPIGVQQMCNGGAAALETALTRLVAMPDHGPVLVTTGDRFLRPGFDRWRGDYGVWYGDGGTAAVLERREGPAGAALVLDALVTEAAPDLEIVHRDASRFQEAPLSAGPTVDVRRTKKAFLTGTGREPFVGRLRETTTRVVASALAEAGLEPGGPALRAVLLPRLGRATARDIYGPAVAAVTPAPVVDLGAGTGHLGAGDVFSNLTALAGDGPWGLRSGEHAVVLSAGAGFTWSGVVVHRP